MIAALLVACGAGNTLPPRQFDVTFTDPDGAEWLAPDAHVSLLDFTGVGCDERSTWVDLGGGTPSLQGWFGFLPTGTLASESFSVRFGGTEDGTTARHLLGGVGELVSRTDTSLEYRLDGARDCLQLGLTQEPVCAEQTAPATFLVEGDVAELGDGDEEPGWPDGVDGSGAPVCGGERPGG